MIVDEVVCGYLVTIEQLAKFADLELQPLPKTRSGFIVRTFQWLRKQPTKLHPIDVYYPRDKDPRTAPYRILFPTRGRVNIDHRYKFNETDEDRRLRDKIMDLHPSIPVLLTDAEFVTFPNPSLSIRLPGEFVVRGPSSLVSEEESD